MLRIAIVEDHESDAKRLTALLEAYAQKNGKRFAITWIANANTFLDSYQHQYELVFMDIRMPGLNGMMAAHELREMDHTVVLVFLTSLAQYAVESYEVEATDYILKPITACARMSCTMLKSMTIIFNLSPHRGLCGRMGR